MLFFQMFYTPKTPIGFYPGGHQSWALTVVTPGLTAITTLQYMKDAATQILKVLDTIKLYYFTL